MTYSGPHYSTFGMKQHFEQTLDWFQSCLFATSPLAIRPAQTWSDDPWFLDQDTRHIEANAGWSMIEPGRARGRLVGGNLSTMSLLFGTGMLPDLAGTILWLEDDLESAPRTFRRHFISLTQQSEFGDVQGLMIGRFQRASTMTEDLMCSVVRSAGLSGVPVLANIDVGHTEPVATFPVGGEAELVVDGAASSLVITAH